MSRSLWSELRVRRAPILAVLGAVLFAVGVALIYPPAGLIVAGFSLVTAGYIDRYMEVQSANAASSGPPG